MSGFPFKAAKAVAYLKAADPALVEIIETIGPFKMELKASRSVFGALAEAIVYQQLSNKAAATIYGRVEALYPRATAGFTPRHILATPDEKLRGCGLSRAKVLAVQDLARRVASGELPTLEQAHGLDDAELIEQLTRVRGIGRSASAAPTCCRSTTTACARPMRRLSGSAPCPRHGLWKKPARNGGPTVQWRAGICGGCWRRRRAGHSGPNVRPVSF